MEENPSSLVTISHMDTTCSLKTTTRQHPTNSSSLDTTTTRLVASSSLDNTSNLVTRALANNDEEREMLKALMKKFDDIITQCQS